MPARRLSTGLLTVALLATILGFGGASTAAAPPAAGQVAAQTAAASSGARAASSARVVGQPPANYVIPQTSLFAFPNRSKADKYMIRNRVLNSVKSVWGGRKLGANIARPGNGTIRMATWSFNDWAMAKALVAARNRGVSVQIVAAKTANVDHAPWRWLKKQLGARTFRSGIVGSKELVSFARECKGSCRGAGGTAHAKYFLFDNVGARHVRHIVVQTSMNLTTMGYQGQWNQAEIWHSDQMWNQFMTVYRETRVGRPVATRYRAYSTGAVTSMFFPFPGGRASTDPVMRMLNQVSCSGATNGSGGHTVLRIINYSIYGDRGVWLAKKLRSLWSAGCDIKIIYSVSSRPVMQILRSGSGRGPMPVRQSVITNDKREIVKYNHSKWMSIVGNYAGNRGNNVTMSGSANWSLFAFNGDEQIQTITSRASALRHNRNFSITWNQGSSHLPGFGIKGSEARMTEQARLAAIPQEPTWGKGIYKYLSPDGD